MTFNKLHYIIQDVLNHSTDRRVSHVVNMFPFYEGFLYPLDSNRYKMLRGKSLLFSNESDTCICTSIFL